jgi:hypothetical protein
MREKVFSKCTINCAVLNKKWPPKSAHISHEMFKKNEGRKDAKMGENIFLKWGTQYLRFVTN